MQPTTTTSRTHRIGTLSLAGQSVVPGRGNKITDAEVTTVPVVAVPAVVTRGARIVGADAKLEALKAQTAELLRPHLDKGKTALSAETLGYEQHSRGNAYEA
jgi:hypothetical protein